MIIALFTDTYLPQKNGVATSVAQLKKHLQLLGHTVYVYTSRVPGYDDAEEDVIRSFSIKMPVEIDANRLALANIPLITHHLYKDKVQIIHSHSEFSMGLTARAVSRLLSIPHVHTVHTMWDDYTHYLFKGVKLTHRQIAIMWRAFSSRFTALIAPSPKASSYLHKIGIPSVTINNGVDGSLFTRTITQEEKDHLLSQLGFTKDDTLALFVGRIASEKRVTELYKSFKQVISQIDNFKVLFVGDGVDLDKLKQQTKEEGLLGRIVFTGNVPYEKIATYYAISHLYCTASLSEVQPMTVIEALISGLPIVARDDLAYKGLAVPEQNGFLAKDDDQLTHYIQQLATNPALRQTYAQKSTEIAQHFTAIRQAEEMANLYAKAIEYGRAKRHSYPLHDPISGGFSEKT